MATPSRPRPWPAGPRRRDRRPAVRRRRRVGSGIEVVLLTVLRGRHALPGAVDARDVDQGEPGRLRRPGEVLRLQRHAGPFQGRLLARARRCSRASTPSSCAGASTLLATVLGVPAAWAYSRFTMRAKKDQLFFILSTRFMPPVVVVIPIFLMYRDLGLIDTLLGLILIYAAFNLPFTIWMMKGFVDEVPGGVRGRRDARRLHPLPGVLARHAAAARARHRRHRGVRADLLLERVRVRHLPDHRSRTVRTAPPAIAGLIGGTTVDWGLVAASAMVFAIPVLVFAFLVRKHLVAGVTLGAVRR